MRLGNHCEAGVRIHAGREGAVGVLRLHNGVDEQPRRLRVRVAEDQQGQGLVPEPALAWLRRTQGGDPAGIRLARRDPGQSPLSSLESIRLRSRRDQARNQ